MIMTATRNIVVLAICLVYLSIDANCQDKQLPAEPIQTAVLPFVDGDDSVKGLGSTASTLTNAILSASDELLMVEREELDAILSEQELSLSGLANPATAAQVGQLTGAKILITGRVFSVGKKYFLAAKLISTETSRVLGETVKFESIDSIDAAAEELAEKITQAVSGKREIFVAKVETAEERLERLRKIVADRKNLPSIFVSIPEEHVSRAIPDPAAQTEIQQTFQDLGFKIMEESASADIQIIGEGFSEVAGRRGPLVSCRARIELVIKGVGEEEEIKVGRQTEAGVDLSENVASKNALQKAGSKIAERILPLLLKQ